ncbi:hypothetical protein [Pedobacter sp.]
MVNSKKYTDRKRALAQLEPEEARSTANPHLNVENALNVHRPYISISQQMEAVVEREFQKIKSEIKP